MSTPKCQECKKPVYLMEQITVNDIVYHNTGCFKCATCKTPLTPATFAALDGTNYCKSHFKQLFKRKGSYNDINPEGLNVDKSEGRKSMASQGE